MASRVKVRSKNDVSARVLSSKDRFWQLADFSGSASTVAHALSELAAAGELRRVRNGLYWRGTKTLLGMSPPPVEKVVERLAGKVGVGPAGPSAANALRLSTQVPRHRHVAVPKRPPTGVGQVTFHDRSARTGRLRAKLAPLEVAVLEVLDDWSNIEVDDDQAWKRLSELARSGSVRLAQLQTAASTEPARVRARLATLADRTAGPVHA